MTVLHLNLDVPSGILLVGSHLHDLTSVGHGFALNTPASLAACSHACAQEGLVEIFMPDLPWALWRSSRGELFFQDAAASLGGDRQLLLRHIFSETHLGLMDGDQYQQRAHGKPATQRGNILRELPVTPGRYRFTLDYAHPLYFAEKQRRRFVFVQGQGHPYAPSGRPN